MESSDLRGSAATPRADSPRPAPIEGRTVPPINAVRVGADALSRLDNDPQQFAQLRSVYEQADKFGWSVLLDGVGAEQWSGLGLADSCPTFLIGSACAIEELYGRIGRALVP